MLHLFQNPPQNLPQLETKTERMQYVATTMIDQFKDQLPPIVAPFLKNFFPHLLDEITEDKVVEFVHTIRKVVDYIDDLESYLQTYSDAEIPAGVDGQGNQ